MADATLIYTENDFLTGSLEIATRIKYLEPDIIVWGSTGVIDAYALDDDTVRIFFSKGMQDGDLLRTPGKYVFTPKHGVEAIVSISVNPEPEPILNPTYVDVTTTVQVGIERYEVAVGLVKDEDGEYLNQYNNKAEFLMGGSVVRILGYYFPVGCRVFFGENEIDSWQIIYRNSNELRTGISSGSGTVNVKAINPKGKYNVLENGWTYT